ncbi:MAG: choice-of-anchor D domain-containing protein [Methylotenera sp.]|nr:choice-of-anchor D domain-containing protein [Oligoflexia bacterium]
MKQLFSSIKQATLQRATTPTLLLTAGMAASLIGLTGCGVSNFAFNKTPTTQTPALLTITGPSVTDFRLQSVNSVTYRSVTVTNTGGADAKIKSLDGLTKTSYIFAGTKGQFAGPKDVCDKVIPAGTNCKLVLGFVPIFGIAKADGSTPLTGTFTLNYDDANDIRSIQHGLTGLADMTPRLYVQDPVDVTGQSYDFGLFRIGATASYIPGAYTKELNLQFYGPPGAAVSNINFVPFVAGAPYAYDLSACRNVNYMTLLNMSCHFKIQFAPISVAPGGSPALLAVEYSDGGSFGAQSGLPASFNVTGESVGPASLQLSSASTLNFGDVFFGTSSLPQVASFTYSGTLPANDIRITVTGPDAARFSTVQPATGACNPASHSVSADCSFSVIFTPDQNRPNYSASVNLSYSDGISNTLIRTVALIGNGIGDLSAVPPALVFDTLPVGNLLSKSTVVTNNSTANVTLSSLANAIPTAGQASFRILSTSTCVAGLVLQSHATCTLNIQFTPQDYVPFVDLPVTVAYVNHNGVADTLRLTLSGRGLPNLTSNTTVLSFGNVPVGNTVNSSVVLTNVATHPISLDLNSIPSSVGQYTITSRPTVSGLAAGASVTLGVTYRPTLLNGATGALDVRYTDSVGKAQNLPTLSFNGNGIPDIIANAVSGTLPVGNTITPTITVQNISSNTVTLDPSTITITGSNQFVITGGTCRSGGTALNLLAGTSCTVTVSLRAMALTTYNGNLIFSYIDTAGNHYGPALPGQPAPLYPSFSSPLNINTIPDLNPTGSNSLSFQNIPVGDSSVQSLSLQNVAGGSIIITAGPSSSGAFAVQPSGACGGGSLGAGSSCSLTVTFTPDQVANNFSASARITYTDSADNAGQTTTLNFSGSSVANLTASPTSRNFGSVAVGESVSGSFTITNVSHAHAINLGSLGASGSGFSLSSNACGGSIAAMASCTLAVQFQARALGGSSGNLAVAYADPYNNSQSLAVALAGTGLPDLVISAGLNTFPDTPVGAKTSQTITLRNATGSAVQLGSISGVAAPYATAAAGTSPCSIGGTLAANDSCNVVIEFSPTSVGNFSANLRISYNDLLGNPQSIPISANGHGFTAAVLALASPAVPYTFASILPGNSNEVSFNLSNSGTTNANQLSLSGGTAEFQPRLVAGTSCGTGADACQIAVRFAPSSSASFGPVTITLSYVNGADATVRTLSFQVSGSGASKAVLTLTDTNGNAVNALDFGGAPLGSGALSKTVRLNNTSAGTAATSVQLQLSNTSNFSIGSTNCSGTLAASSNCSITLNYSPHAASAAPGRDSGAFNVSYNDGFNAGAAQVPTVNLSGASTIGIQLAAGYSHSCAISTLGLVSCWGKNDAGQMGIGSADTSVHSSAVQVNLGASNTARSVAVGYRHTCAVLQDNSLKCWGDNSGGQLGLDNTTQQNAPPPGAINLGEAVRSVTAGNHHTCALLASGHVKCWGSTVGQPVLGLGSLDTWGDGSHLMANLPVIALGENGTATQISAGFSHTCAVLSGSSHHLKCWGNNAAGQLGQPGVTSLSGEASTTPDHITPIDLGGNHGAASVSAGNGFTCAVLDDNTGVKCWGRLGNAGTVASQYGNLGKCWSANTSGQFVDCSASTNSPMESYGTQAGQMGNNLPVVNLGSNVSVLSVAAANNHACAEVLAGSQMRIKCWGSNAGGQLGIGLPMDNSASSQRGADQNSMGDALSAVTLASGEMLAGLTTSLDHTCVWYASGKSQCWGKNASGQLGYGNTTNLNSPGALVQW